MKTIIARHLLIFSFFLPFASSAQDLTGIWKGYFITETGEYYKLEFQVAQNSGYGVTGVSYSYLDVRFYGKATMTGSFVKSSANFRIREIRTVEVRSSLGGGTCIMNYNFHYTRSGKEEYLEGTYLGKFESKYAAITGRWGECGGGKVFLRKVTTTDFYIEPFLKNKIRTKPIIENLPPLVKKEVPKKDTVRVLKKPVIVKTNPPVSKPITKTNIPVIPKKDTSKNIHIDPPVTKKTDNVPTPAVIRNRSNELVKVLLVHDPNVTVRLFDNGEIDGDTISVFLDKKLVISAKRLTASPLEVKIKMDEDNSEHELTMVAENLGSIPPNTSLMIVEAGEQRFEVRITSTEQKNAVVRFKYQKNQ